MKGNKHFREQRFDKAARCYEKAIMTYGPRAVYANNLAATYLKLERCVCMKHVYVLVI